jgi:hypothetical protein
MKFLPSVILALMLVTTGCSAESAQSASTAPELLGLDAVVVEEILNSQIVSKRLSGMAEDATAAMRQGIAMNFPLCRAAYSAYKTWLETGEVGELAEINQPDQPIQLVMQQYSRDRALFSDALHSGDIAILRDLLTNQSGCGAWITVSPGVESGQTIAKAVRGL